MSHSTKNARQNPQDNLAGRSSVPSPETIREAREHLGMSQSQFAFALGLNRQQTVSDWERGKKQPPPFLTLALQELSRKADSRES